MIGSPLECNGAEGPGRRTRIEQCAVLGAVCVLVIGVYAWSAQSLFREFPGAPEDKTYYNLLAEGLCAGQLNLKSEVPSELARSANLPGPKANPATPVSQHPLSDVSFYQGKLYLYFGVTPVVLLFWPYHQLTDRYLFHKDAVVIFLSLGFLASVVLLSAVWRRYFPAVKLGVLAACALALGWANFTPVCLPRGGVYDVAISCGYAIAMVTLALLWPAMHAPRRRGWWLAAASLAYGLAVGARPSLLFGAVILLVPVLLAWRQAAPPGQRRRAGVVLRVAAVPILLIGSGLMLYNYLRFNNPLEFGWRYQLSWAGQHFLLPQQGIHPFGLRFLRPNLQVYLLEPAHWSARFPFLHDIQVPIMPAGHRLLEHPFGILSNIPLVWLALVVPLIWRDRLGELRSSLRWSVMALILLTGICALTLGLFFATCSRYQVEFLPPLVLLAVLGILGLEWLNVQPPAWRRWVRCGWSTLLAFSACFNLLAMFEDASDLYVSRGVIFFNEGRLAEAVACFRRGLAVQPDNARAHSNLGTALVRDGKVPEGIAHLEAALRLRPDYTDARNNLAAVLLKQGKAPEAMAHYLAVQRLKPDDAEAHNNLAVALLEQGKVPEAVGQLEQAERLRPEDAKLHLSLGVLLFGQDKLPEAVNHLEQAVRLAPQHAQAHNNLGVALFKQGKLIEAVEHLEQAVQLRPDDPEARDNLGRAQFRLAETLAARNEWDEAPRHYLRAIEMKTDHARAYEGLAVALTRLGRSAEALENHQKALAIREKAFGPQHAEVSRSLNHLAQLYTTQHRFTEAEGLYKRVLAIQEKAHGPDNSRLVSSLNNLAALYKTQGRYAEAKPLYQRALAIREKAFGSENLNVSTTLNNLALLYDTEGDFPQAELMYARSLAIKEKAHGPANTKVVASLYNLAAVYRNQGRYAHAESLYQRALAIQEKDHGPEHPFVATSLNKLAKLYEAQSQYSKAESFYQRALAIREKALGPEHPSVATSLGYLVQIYRATGREGEAKALEARAQRIRALKK